MKKFKKLTALFLAALLLMMATVVPAAAATEIDPSAGVTQKLQTVMYQILDKIVSTLVKVLNVFVPGLNWNGTIPSEKNYQSVNFYPGEAAFDTNVYENSKWSVGYSSASLLEGLNVLDGTFYMAGSLEVTKGRAATEILDDQRVNAFAISDGTSGTVLYAVIDGYGIARGDVLEIRSRLADFAAANNIISINISVLHQHSCIDILGMGAPLLSALVKNPALSLINKDKSEYVSGKNNTFMDNLYTVVSQAMVNAYNDMTEGSLYYGHIDASGYMHDKRSPEVFDGNINRIRFVPDSANENEIWICEAGIHCVGLGVSTSKISGDYPYYFRNYIKEQTNADVVYIEGAELAITTDYSLVEYDSTASDVAKVQAMGEALGALTISVSNDVQLDPVLNIKLTETDISADNQILVLAVREGLVNSVVTTDFLQNYTIKTEVGYLELGNQLGIMLSPGEIAPEILWGGATSSEQSWLGEDWTYAPLEETAGVKLICFGLCNDQIGYILPDNDFRSMFTENEEINASSNTSASTVATAFESILNSVK